MTKDTASDTKTLRAGSKAAALLEMLQRKDGASLDEMTERTGWQPHTVRAAMTGLRKKGHVIDKRPSGNTTVWFIGAEAAA
jgi:DNA-binding IclR family transcriptional regulator